MTYTEYIRSFLERKDHGTPIYTDELAEAVSADPHGGNGELLWHPDVVP